METIFVNLLYTNLIRNAAVRLDNLHILLDYLVSQSEFLYCTTSVT